MSSSELVVTFIGKDKSLSSTANKIGGPFSKLGGVVKAGAAIGVTALAGFGAAVVGIGAQLIGMGSSAEEMLGKFNVVFAQTGGQVTGQLSAFANEVGRSKFELLAMASTFGDTLKPMGFTEEAAAGMSVELSKLATDLGSFNDMEMSESLERLQGVLIGNHENALAFGVIINENTLKAELAKNGWENLTGAALEQAKVQARINLLMAGTTDAQGDAARTSQSWANQMRALKATVTDAATELGLKLLPAVTPLLAMIGSMAKEAVPFLTSAFEKILPKIQVVAGAIQQLIIGLKFGQDPVMVLTGLFMRLASMFSLSESEFEAVSESISNIMTGIVSLKDQIIEFITPIIEWVTQFVTIKDVMIALGIVIGAIVVNALIGLVTAVAPVIAAGIALIAIVSLVRNAWEQDWGGIRTALTEAWTNHIKPALEALWTFLSTILIPFVQNTLVPILVDYVGLQLQALAFIWQTVLLPAIQFVWQWMQDVLIPFISGVLIPFIQENLAVAIQALTDFWQTVLLPAIQNVQTFIETVLVPIFQALWELLKVAGALAITILQGVFENVLLPALNSVWSFIQTSIIPILEQLWAIIQQTLAPAIDSITSMFKNWESGMGGVASAVQNVIGWIGDLKESLSSVKLPD